MNKDIPSSVLPNDFTEIVNRDYVHEVLEAEIGSKYVEYRNKFAEAASMFNVPEYPIQLDFELNYSCNLTCIMCTWSAENNKGKGKKTWMSFETYKKIIDDGVPKGLQAVRLSYINEPLMRNDLISFIDYARQAGIVDVYFSTNGMLLTEKYSRLLINSGLTRLQVSIDATTENTYQKIRRGGDFYQVKNNILTYLKIRDECNKVTPLLRVNFVKTTDNIEELNDFINEWTGISDSIGVQNLVGIMSKKTTLDHSEIRHFHCNQPFYHLTIRFDGTILPCCTFFGVELPIGRYEGYKSALSQAGPKVKSNYIDEVKTANLESTTISSAWNNAVIKELREIHLKGEYWKNPVCKKCVES